MGLGANDEGMYGGVAGIDALLLKGSCQTCGVAGYAVQGCCTEVGDELYVTLAVAGAGRNGECAQTLCGILNAQTAGEHAVT